MAMYEYQGVVEEIGQTQSFGTSGFTKREVIIGNDIDSDNRYPNPVKFTFKKTNCSLLDGVSKGERVKIRFAIDGRRWDGGTKGPQYFVDLTGLKIEKVDESGSVAPEPASAMASDVDREFVDDVPF